MHTDFERIREIFLAIVEQPSPQWESLLNGACGNKPDLRQQVAALLQAHAEGEGILDRNQAGQAQTGVYELLRERPGTVIGPYKLLQQIGEGGMGTVFMAEQQQPVRRKVALKVIKPGMDSRQIITRFEAERQALALMDHPNIARVFDAGATDSGRPYFVMELVKGMAITDYCDQQQLTPRERLGLFVSVCHAVQHAHQKGIIHRDIKPNNVLITEHDGTPVVKVIDFGIAKATGQQLTDKTLFTNFAEMIGTPLYLSPEQAALSGLDIDTRSDIYSLGVLLYELLTGVTPFDKERFRQAAYDEIRRIIREEEPLKPSTRLSTAGQAATTLSAQRKSDPKRLSKLFRGDLDWIVMKALEKDRNRRYETANGFATDVQRYLADEPVQACPPSAGYRFRKFARRNKGVFTSATVILGIAALILAGSIGWLASERAIRMSETTRVTTAALDESASWQQKRRLPEALSAARRAADLVASGTADDALRQRVQARVADLELLDKLENARLESSETIDNVFDELGRDGLYGEIFRAAGLDLENIQAEVAGGYLSRSTVAVEIAAMLDDWATVRRRNRGPADVSWKHLVDVARAADPDAQRCQLRDAIKSNAREAMLAQAKPQNISNFAVQTVWSLCFMLSDEVDAFRELEAILREAQHQHPDDFWINDLLGQLLMRTRPSRPVEEVQFLAVAVALRPQSSRAHNNFGLALEHKNDFDGAIKEYRRAIEYDPKNAVSHSNLGVVLVHMNRLDDAVAEFHTAIAIDSKNALAHNNLGKVLETRHQLADAIEEYKKAVDIDPMCKELHVNLGIALYAKKELDFAIAEFNKAIELDPKDVGAHSGIGLVLHDKNQLDAAIVEFNKAIALDAKDAKAYYNLGRSLATKKQWDAAIAEFKKAIALDPTCAPAYSELGHVLTEMNQLDDAIAEFHKAIVLDPKDALTHNHLGVALIVKNQFDAAIAEFNKGIALDPQQVDLHENLASAMYLKKQWAEAIAEYQKALSLNPKNPTFHYNLANALGANNDFDAAIREYRVAIELDPKNPEPLQQLDKVLHRKELHNKLPAVLQGTQKPADANEGVEMAEVCLISKQLPSAAVRLYEAAFAERKDLADNLQVGHRNNAACAAALAGTGNGKDAPGEENDRARYREKALAWLRADREAWRVLLDKEPEKAAIVAEKLKHWQEDSDLEGIRAPEALGKLPEAERGDWQRLWQEVEALRQRAQAKLK